MLKYETCSHFTNERFKKHINKLHLIQSSHEPLRNMNDDCIFVGIFIVLGWREGGTCGKGKEQWVCGLNPEPHRYKACVLLLSHMPCLVTFFFKKYLAFGAGALVQQVGHLPCMWKLEESWHNKPARSNSQGQS